MKTLLWAAPRHPLYAIHWWTYQRLFGLAMMPAALALLLLALAMPASAELKFCNKVSTDVLVAVGYVAKDAPGVSTGGHRGVTVEGWWRFVPGECAAVADIGRATDYWIYFTAHGASGRWDGPTWLCVSKTPFKTVGEFMRAGDTCVGSRYLASFQRVDANAAHYTVNLTR